jgi:ABC-2 type transport system permease protein
LKYVRAAARAFEMSMKVRVVNPFSYLNWLIFPLIFVVLGLFILSPGGAGRSAYAILGGGLIGYWSMAYLEGGNEIQNERWSGTLEQVMGCPTPLGVIVVGKLCSSLLVGALSFIPAIALSYFLFHQSLQHVDLALFAASFLVLTFAFFSLAIALAPLYALWRWAFTVTNGFEISVYVLCGFMFPVSQLPSWLQGVSAVLAPTWATRSLYAAAGQPFGHDYVLWCSVSIVLSCGYLVVGWILFRIVEVRARVTGQLALV